MFEAATIHYAVAKLAGPFVFGCGWCGWACWTAMVLDLLPYKLPAGPRRPWGWVRGAVLAASFVFVAALFLAGVPDLPGVMFWAFIWGNAAYYAVGVVLAFACRDNRAFCKYVCPVSLMMKPAARYARIRVTCDAERCVRCGRCKRACPMDVDMLSNSRSRANGTECILCGECLNACPKGALKLWGVRRLLASKSRIEAE